LRLEREYIFSIVGLEALIKRKISTQTGNRSFDPEIKHGLSIPRLLILPTALVQPKCWTWSRLSLKYSHCKRNYKILC